MSAAEHVLAFLFAAPAGALAYFTLARADHPEIDMRHFLAVILMFILPLIGLPEIAGSTVIYFLVGIGLAAFGPRLTGQGRPTPTGQDDHRRQQPAGPQGPQPPRRAVQVDRELAYDPDVLADHDKGFDLPRWIRMCNALTEEEYAELEQFWQWQRDTGQTRYTEPPRSALDDIADDTGDEITIWTDQ